MRQLVSFKAYIRHIFVRYILALIVLMMTIFLGFMLFHYEVYVVRESRQASENLCTLLTAEWQRFITEHWYTCTKEILAGLGEMYTADARFTENLDANGAGTAQFMHDAIAAYCV